MTTGSTGTKRRTLLQRGFALLAGGAAIAGGSRWAAAASPPAAAPPKTITLYARKGDVFDRPGGERIGSFYTNTVGAQSPFGVPEASSLEMRTLQVREGTLFTVGATSGTGPRAMAIIGGTDRFAGRTGSCVERAIAGEHAADDMRELTITFAG